MKEKRFFPINPFTRPGEELNSIYGLVFHWVGNAGTSANANSRYFETLAKQDEFDNEADVYASAHYVIDDNIIIQMMPDREVAYHAGSTWWNRNSIGIEICHPDWRGRFTEKTLSNVISLSVQLCLMYEIDPLAPKNFMRHYDITGKVCPKWWVDHPDEWHHFQKMVARNL